MSLIKEAIEEYKRIYKKNFGEEISDEGFQLVKFYF